MVFEAVCWCYQIWLYQQARPGLTDEKNQPVLKTKELDELQRHYTQKKGYNVIALRSTNVIVGKYARQIFLLDIISVNLFPTKCHSEKKNFSRMPDMEVCLAKLKVILKCVELSGKTLPSFQPSSGTLMLPEGTLVRLWKTTPRRKDFWLNPREC